MTEKILLSVEEALSRIADGDKVHTFLNPSGFLVGADWPREQLIAEMTAAVWIKETGEQAQAMKHGIAFLDLKDRIVFVETKEKTP